MATITKTNSSLTDLAQNHQILEVINRSLAYAIIIAGFLSVVFIFWGGISFIISGGQEDKIKSAVSTIRYAIIGLVVTIAAVFIITVVGNLLGINVIQYINFKDIIETITNITSTNNSSSLR